MRLKTAQELRIRELYRYQPFNIDWLKQTVEENIIFMSNPAVFNDPWDCKPHFNSDVNDPKVRKDIIDYYLAAHKKNYPDGGGSHIQDKIKELDANPDKLKAFIDKTSTGVGEDIDKQYRVCCLTTKPTCTLMWSHYAQNHTGVCLEFQVRNDVFCGALQIEYEENYPPFQLTDEGAEENVRALTTKSRDWAYEDEYRLIALEKESPLPKQEMLVVENNLLSIPDGALLSIIVGCRMAQDHKAAIKKLLDGSGKDIALKQAVRFPNKYGLNIDNL